MHLKLLAGNALSEQTAAQCPPPPPPAGTARSLQAGAAPPLLPPPRRPPQQQPQCASVRPTRCTFSPLTGCPARCRCGRAAAGAAGCGAARRWWRRASRWLQTRGRRPTSPPAMHGRGSSSGASAVQQPAASWWACWAPQVRLLACRAAVSCPSALGAPLTRLGSCYMCPAPTPHPAPPLACVAHTPASAGSGKTTLLAMLAGSTEDLDRRSSLTGSVCLDGQPLSAANRRRVRLTGGTAPGAARRCARTARLACLMRQLRPMHSVQQGWTSRRPHHQTCGDACLLLRPTHVAALQIAFVSSAARACLPCCRLRLCPRTTPCCPPSRWRSASATRPSSGAPGGALGAKTRVKSLSPAVQVVKRLCSGGAPGSAAGRCIRWAWVPHWTSAGPVHRFTGSHLHSAASILGRAGCRMPAPQRCRRQCSRWWRSSGCSTWPAPAWAAAAASAASAAASAAGGPPHVWLDVRLDVCQLHGARRSVVGRAWAAVPYLEMGRHVAECCTPRFSRPPPSHVPPPLRAFPRQSDHRHGAGDSAGGAGAGRAHQRPGQLHGARPDAHAQAGARARPALVHSFPSGHAPCTSCLRAQRPSLAWNVPQRP